MPIVGARLEDVLVLALTVGGGALAGRLLGGHLRALARLSVRRSWLLALALGAQLGGFLLAGDAPGIYPAGLALSAVLATAFLVLNPDLAGGGLLLAGLILNTAVIVANGAMPVAVSAASRAGLVLTELQGDPRHQLAGPGTALGSLGDVVPLPLPGAAQVLSPGDILVFAGLGLCIAVGMRDPGPRAEAVPARPSPAGADRGVGDCRHGQEEA